MAILNLQTIPAPTTEFTGRCSSMSNTNCCNSTAPELEN